MGVYDLHYEGLSYFSFVGVYYGCGVIAKGDLFFR